MHAFKQQNHCKTALGNLAKFSFLLVIFMNSEGCESKPLGKNFEQLTEMIRIADPMEIRSASRNQWKEVHQHPLFQRYHGLGADFSARGYPFHSSDTSEEETYPVMEVRLYIIVTVFVNFFKFVKSQTYTYFDIIIFFRKSLKWIG